MEKLSEEGSKLGVAEGNAEFKVPKSVVGGAFQVKDSATAEVVRSGKVLKNEDDKSDKPKGDQNG